LLQQPGITSVIIGAKTMEQLEDNLQAADLTLTSAELEILDSASALPVEYPAWMEAFQNRDRMVLPD
jgi:aryl-alcohol dehydrogenase-like predicted oxidoreductase